MKYFYLLLFITLCISTTAQVFVEGHTDIEYSNSIIPGLTIKNPNSGLLSSSMMRIYNNQNHSLELGVRSSSFAIGPNNSYLNAGFNRALDIYTGGKPRMQIDSAGYIKMFNDDLNSISFKISDTNLHPYLNIGNFTDPLKMVTITDDGRLIVGFNRPTIENVSLDIFHQSGEKGITIQNQSILDFWSVEVDAAADYTWRYAAGTPGAYIDLSDGANYKTFSDLRLKKNVADLPSILDKVLLLRPTQYHFEKINKDSESKTIGFIAQEVEKIFPNLISEKEGYKSLAYSAFGVIAIKAIQEQQSLINNQSEKIAAMQKQIDRLNDLVESFINKN